MPPSPAPARRTYSTLVSAGRGKSRLQQLVHWLGPGFDGALVFDECHKVGGWADGRVGLSAGLSSEWGCIGGNA